MDNTDFHRRLVDLYAGRELPTELEEQLEAKAHTDPDLKVDMMSLRGTVDLVRLDDEATFTEESYQRILTKLMTRGASVTPMSPEPAHLQYQLPIQG